MEEKIEFRVPVTRILDVQKHPNADKLSVVKCFDFNVITSLDRYKVGDFVIYAPIDCILPQALEEKLFPIGSKVKLNKSRIRQINIRKLASQGMIIDILDVIDYFKELPTEGDNVATILGITKYEPPETDFSHNLPKAKKERNRAHENPYFHAYNGLNNIKYFRDMFLDGQEVVFDEKIHGTSFKFGILPYKAKTFFDKVKDFFGLLPSHQFCYGSNGVQLQAKKFQGYYATNVYAEACKNYDILNKVKKNETVYAEIYGSGIQKNYTYGCAEGERKIVVFDIKVLADDKQSYRWLNVEERKAWCEERGLPLVPELYRGPYSRELADQYTKGASVLDASQKVREGVVIRDPNETVCYYGKKIFKLLSEDYLADPTNSDNH